MLTKRPVTASARPLCYAVVCSLVPAVGCGSEETPPDESPWSAHYFSGAEGAWSCLQSKSVPQIADTAELVLFRGVGITDEDVVLHTSGTGDCFSHYDLDLVTNSQAEPVDIETIIVGSDEDLYTAATEAGIPAYGTLTQAEHDLLVKVTGEVVFAPLREFLKRRPRGGGHIDAAVIERLAAEETGTWFANGSLLAGFGLSPALLQSTDQDDPLREIYSMLDIDDSVTPFVFVGHELTTAYWPRPSEVLAHEMGHAMGLSHVDDRDNLMAAADTSSCPVLSGEQVSTLTLKRSAGDLYAWESARVLRRAVNSAVEHTRALLAQGRPANDSTP